MNTEITNAVNAAGDKAQYDARVKRILAQKNILAHILVKTVDEFKGMKPEDVVTYIEGEPKVGIVPVEPGLTNVEKIDAYIVTTDKIEYTFKNFCGNYYKIIKYNDGSFDIQQSDDNISNSKMEEQWQIYKKNKNN